MNVMGRRGSPCLAAALFFAGAGCGIFSPGDLPPLDGRTEALEDHEGTVCSEDLIPCGGFCIDPETDRLNCGVCGNVCEVTEQCRDGDCTCPDPYVDCGGTCVNTAIDRRHCGSCSHACDALAVCSSGLCNCPTGYEDCGGDCVDLNTDNENCGSCGNACTGGEFCNGTGSCALECGSPYTLCNPGPDGYCADLQSDPSNCSACGSACPEHPASISTCSSGACGISCDAGFGNANGSIEDGCECTITNPTELCDAVDNDCNGTTDDGFDCTLGDSMVCTLIASCTGGRLCGAGCTWGPCENNLWACTTPGETRQQDCGNGSCGTQARSCTDTCDWSDWGSCSLKPANTCFTGATQGCGDCGTQTCESSCQWGSCTGEGCHPTGTQTCTTSCGTTGTQTCNASCAWGNCEPPAETCNGADDDCDGTCDEPALCCVGERRCCTMGGDSGYQICTSSCSWGPCERCPGPPTWVCCNEGTECCHYDCSSGDCQPL
jgi:hypothetical protein